MPHRDGFADVVGHVLPVLPFRRRGADPFRLAQSDAAQEGVLTSIPAIVHHRNLIMRKTKLVKLSVSFEGEQELESLLQGCNCSVWAKER